MRVFLVDDDLKVLAVMSRMIHELNMAGAFCTDKDTEIISKIEAFKPDVIILDLKMPHISGEDLYLKIRNTKGLEGIPIVALSASEDLIDKMNTIGLGFNQYLSKPVDKDKLLRSVRSHVSLKLIAKECEQALKVMEKY